MRAAESLRWQRRGQTARRAGRPPPSGTAPRPGHHGRRQPSARAWQTLFPPPPPPLPIAAEPQRREQPAGERGRPGTDSARRQWQRRGAGMRRGPPAPRSRAAPSPVSCLSPCLPCPGLAAEDPQPGEAEAADPLAPTGVHLPEGETGDRRASGSAGLSAPCDHPAVRCVRL